MKRISVVTINFNTENATNNLISSIEKAKKDKYEMDIIVVDNGSDPHIKLDEKKNVKLIRSEINTGFTGGNNIGIKEALSRGSDFVLIINNDTVVDQDLIINLMNVLEGDESIGVAVPKIYFAKGHEFHKDRYSQQDLGKVIWFAGGSIDWDNAKSMHRGLDEVDKGQYENIEKIDFATGCCMMVKREVLEKVGLFDDRYFLYYEDSDLSERIKKAGFDIYYVPDAILFHENASSSGGSGSNLHDYFLTRNQMLFGTTYAPFRTKIALFRQSLVLLLAGRKFQKKGIIDYYTGKFNKGTFFNKNE